MKQVDCLESMNFLKNESREQLDSQENVVDKTSIVSPSINGAPFIIDLNDQDMKSAAVSLEEIKPSEEASDFQSGELINDCAHQMMEEPTKKKRGRPKKIPGAVASIPKYIVPNPDSIA